jgi:hypothetical protein
METFMSNIYIMLKDRDDVEYRCDSLGEALSVANYIVSKYGAYKTVESTSSTMLEDFETLTSYVNSKEVNNG